MLYLIPGMKGHIDIFQFIQHAWYIGTYCDITFNTLFALKGKSA